MRAIITIILTIMLFALFSCGKQESSTPEVDLHTAVLTDDLEAIRQHIKAGSDLDVPESTRESTPLITAAYLGRIEAAKILLEGGADINRVNADGSTALITAIAFEKTKAAKLLIDAGTDLNIQNKDGSSALHTAAFFCNVEIVEALLEKGVDKNLKSKTGKTALQIVELPFEFVKDAYYEVGERLKPLGIMLDYDHIESTRPKITEMLK